MKSSSTSLPQNAVLFGPDPTPVITAIDLKADDQVTVYRRQDNTVRREDAPFQPFAWLTEPVVLQGFDRKVDYVSLAGRGPLKTLARFQGWRDFQKARSILSRTPSLTVNDPVHQYLMATGRTLFKDMRFDQLRRMQLHVVIGGDHILQAVHLSDSHGRPAELTGAEPKILKQLIAAVAERDPDVLEGHDIFRSGLAQLAARARQHKVPLKLGRDGSAISSRQSRIQIAERTIQYPRCEIAGRHVVDTFLLTLFYDVSTREIESFDLPDVAEYFGIGETGALAVAKLSALLSPSFFIQAQIFPYNYQDVVIRGNATKIDALFLREYLHQQHAIPEFPEPRPYAGGYTDVFREGIVRNVWHCDAQSLYPSLLLAGNIQPGNDDLNLFLPLLRDLREFRLRAKRAAKDSASETDRQHNQALQLTFKILINSFYGYLGFSQGHFADFDAAELVTARGRETLQTMLDWLRQRGASVIEIDTDGLYFVPPADTSPETLERELQQALPKGVDVEIDGQYPAMFSYKMKNYALLDTDGRLHVTGSALRSRGLEKFQRRFLEEMLTLALRGEAKKIPHVYETYCEQIERRLFPIEMLAKTDTLQDTLDAYRQKIAKSARNRSAAYELALAADADYQPGDRISYYVTGDTKRVSVYENSKLVTDWNPARRDENVEYYLDKLKTLYKKFAPILEIPGAQ